MFKQNDAELEANKTRVEEAILPAVLETTNAVWTDTQDIARWLAKNCVVDGGLVDASPENLIRAITALDRAQLIHWKVAPVKVVEKKEKRFDYAQQTNDGARPNHAKAEKQEAQVVLAANDVNSPVFQQRNAEAKAKFEDLVARGPITYRRNREDRGMTIARRELLQKIRVVCRQRDAEGGEVPLYPEMVKKAEEQIKQFEKEDARREMS